MISSRAFLVVVSLVMGGSAPMQCGEPEPIQYARRDDAAEVVWRLATRLRERGHTAAAVESWRYLVERYPSSRWAERARQELESIDADGPGSPSPRNGERDGVRGPSASTESSP